MAGMLQRNPLYTAVTRAKQLVVLIGSRHALATAVRTQGPAAAPPPSPNRSGQDQDEQAQGDPSEAPGFGDRISRQRQRAALGHQLPAKRPFIARLGSRPSGQVRHREGCSEARIQGSHMQAGASK